MRKILAHIAALFFLGTPDPIHSSPEENKNALLLGLICGAVILAILAGFFLFG